MHTTTNSRRIHDTDAPETEGVVNLTGRIMSYEQGDLDEWESIELFSDLVASGIAWQLQGSYGRTASALIDGGILDREGSILLSPQDID